MLALVLPILKSDTCYTYEIPADLQVEVGHLVLIPFGKKIISGVVMGFTDERPEGLKTIIDLADEKPVASAELLKLSQWIAEYYLCTWGEALGAALPSLLLRESKRLVYPTHKISALKISPTAALILQYLAEHPQGIRPEQIAKGIGKAVRSDILKKLENAHLIRIENQLQAPKIKPKTEKHLKLLQNAQVKGEKQAEILKTLAEFLANGEPEPAQNEVLAFANATSASIKALVEKGYLEIIEKEVLRTPYGDIPDVSSTKIITQFTLDQSFAIREISEAVQENQFKSFLLHGITGSGKTEVYIEVLKQCLLERKTGIVLVPEIALTPQTVRRFRRHFGNRIAVLHSQMSVGERFDAWRALRDGRYKIAIGPRSAVFAPLPNLGAIIVDEEHESSYKQQSPAPRYHARDVAIYRAHLNNAVVVLGSATPSMESWVNAHTAKSTLLSLAGRVPKQDGTLAQLPAMKLVDLSDERRRKRLHGFLSNPLREAITSRLEKGEQVILLQNRRGYAPTTLCTNCGYVPKCRNCSVPMTYHKTDGKLHCHYCSRKENPSRTCYQCGDEVAWKGAGTQRIEEELTELFPDANIIRMDADTTARKDSHQQLLDEFAKQGDILIGTQMIAKGLDFPRVTLVGIIQADANLQIPDFRAGERTFQLLTQVAGRAGRHDLKGEVILQALQPSHPVLQLAMTQDFIRFAELDLPPRKPFNFPPFGKLIAIEFNGFQERQVEATAQRFVQQLRQHLPDWDIADAMPAFLFRLQRRYRYLIQIRTKRQTLGELKTALQQLQSHFKLENDIRMHIDVEPIGVY